MCSIQESCLSRVASPRRAEAVVHVSNPTAGAFFCSWPFCMACMALCGGRVVCMRSLVCPRFGRARSHFARARRRSMARRFRCMARFGCARSHFAARVFVAWRVFESFFRPRARCRVVWPMVHLLSYLTGAHLSI